MAQPQGGAVVHHHGVPGAAPGGAALQVGARIASEKGEATVEDIRVFDGIEYCLLRLAGGETTSMPRVAAERSLRAGRSQRSEEGGGGARGRRLNLTGRVRTYNPLKGWGFIVCDEVKEDIFLHSKNIVGRTLSQYIGHLRNSQDDMPIVCFDLDMPGSHRPQALNVRLAGGTPPSEAERGAGAVSGRGAAPGLERGVAAEGGAAAEGDATPRRAAQEGEPATPPRREGRTPPEGSSGGTPPPLAAWGGSAKPRPRLFMRGIPFTATANDVVSFFEGFGVHRDSVTLINRKNGNRSGTAYVEFVRQELAIKACTSLNGKNMGSRYIELFPVSQDGATQPAPESSSTPSTPPRRSQQERPPQAMTPEPVPVAAAVAAGGAWGPVYDPSCFWGAAHPAFCGAPPFPGAAGAFGFGGLADLGFGPGEMLGPPKAVAEVPAIPPTGSMELAQQAYAEYRRHLQEAAVALSAAQQHLEGQRDARAAAALDALPPLGGFPLEALAALCGMEMGANVGAMATIGGMAEVKAQQPGGEVRHYHEV